MGSPRLEIDLEQLEKNARAVVSFCSDYGIEVTGVTKAVCGMPQAAKAMIRGGVKGIGESRLENISRLRSSGVNEPVMLLRIPPITEVEEIVSSVDISLNSELPVLRGLSEAALKKELFIKLFSCLTLVIFVKVSGRMIFFMQFMKQLI